MISFLGIAQTYFIYPLSLFLFGKKRQVKSALSTNFDIAVVIAAYNEENVIEKKIQSVLATSYPLDKLVIYVGSDASTDRTNEIVANFGAQYPNVQLKIFQGRTGKAGIINSIIEQCKEELLILTDANVFFTPSTIPNLVRHFSENETHQVCANILKISDRNENIQALEKGYLLVENQIKLRESASWGFVMGAEGGCYAIRRTAYTPIPPNFYMDDFFVTMSVIANKGRVIFDEEAICYEDLPTESTEEFKRKIRISIGNFQNLVAFKKLLWPFWSAIAYSFISHKILRWLTPFFLILLFLVSFLLSFDCFFFQVLALVQCVLFLSPLAIPYLKWMKPALFVAHFYNMNLALLIGFFRYLKGVKSSVWQPTPRSKN
ncbi:MAG: glycosyltransferase [Crocinitomicaceae bacterium]|nr:glycosyltransferase [Crocinitomicaceae bacterium]MCF8443454.1 glycosyltransferase [Crocinitomicaceae bacterium]